MYRIFLLFVAILGFGTIATATKNPKPFVIPEILQWTGSDGQMQPGKQIVVKDKSLMEVARALAVDYHEMFGQELRVITGKPKPGDFVLSLNKKDKALGKEGYRMKVGTYAEVTAATIQGVYWGTRTILQISEQTAERTLPRGEALDVPQYELRGLLMDVARKYTPIDYLHKLVKVMAYYKMNCLQVHLNDNGFKQFFGDDWNKTSSAFRLESETFPGLATPGASYSKREFIDFQKMAEKHFVEIIPEIDVPAHSLAFVHLKPELASKDYGYDHLDIFNPKTYEFVDALFREYLEGKDPVFRGKRVNIGTDEYSNRNEEVREKFRYFTDRYIRYVESFGKQVALWGSLKHAYGKTPVKADNVVMMCWSDDFSDSKEMKKAGFQLVSIPDRYTYIVPAAGYYYDYLNTEYLHNNWTPAVTGGQVLEDNDPALLGGMFAVWNDHYGNGISVKDIHHRLMPAMQVMALKTWSAHKTTIPYALYNSQRLLLSEAPGVNELGRFKGENREVYAKEKVQAGETLPHEEIGYDYTITFTWTPTEETKGTILFESANAKVFLSDPKTGRLGFARDGYLNTFNFKPQVGKAVEIKIVGNNKKTALYVNGKHRQTLDPEVVFVASENAKFDVQYEAPDPFQPIMYHTRGRMHYQRTLVFPLRKAGNFKSAITNLKVYNYAQF